MSVVGLWFVDRAHRKPDEKYDNDHNVDYCANQVHSPNELRALHSQETLHDQQSEECQIDMPHLDLVGRISDLAYLLIS